MTECLCFGIFSGLSTMGYALTGTLSRNLAGFAEVQYAGTRIACAESQALVVRRSLARVAMPGLSTRFRNAIKVSTRTAEYVTLVQKVKHPEWRPASEATKCSIGSKHTSPP